MKSSFLLLCICKYRNSVIINVVIFYLYAIYFNLQKFEGLCRIYKLWDAFQQFLWVYAIVYFIKNQWESIAFLIL